jgi:L-ascorbate metabolism protein UlaG (beta-lactamase superfamily)
MTRYLATCLTVLTLVGAGGAQEAKKLTLIWHGQSFFELITSKGTRVVFDPHAIEVFGRKVVSADLVLISHYHSDHTQVGVIENREKAKVILGLKGDPRKADWNIVDEKFQDVRIRSIGVYHDSSEGMERGKNAIWSVEADGLNIVHLGDLGHQLTAEQLKAIGPVDVLMVPVGGVYGLNGSEAKRVVAQIKPRQYIIPMHYGTPIYDDLLTVEEFLEEQKEDNIRRHTITGGKNVRRYPVTNKLVIETDFKPAEPIIAVLHWK